MSPPVDTAPSGTAVSRPRAEEVSGSFAARLRSRRWRPRGTRRSVLLVIAALLVAILVFGLWALLGSSWFTVSQVTVTGERTLTAAEVRSAAAVPTGTALVRVNLEAVQQRVSALKPVAHASVHRSWPHTIAITVTERKPVAVMSSADGWALIDKAGVAYRTVAKSPPGLPVIDVPSPPPPDVLQSAATVISSLPSALLRQVSTVRASTLDSITLQLRNGRSVLWGDAADNAAKAQVLTVLLKHKASAYDVSVPAEPTLTRP